MCGYETWAPPDPAGWDAGDIRPLREDVDRRVQALIAELTTNPTPTSSTQEIP